MSSFGSAGSAGRHETAGHMVMHRLDELAQFSAEREALTRLYLTVELKAAALQVQAWMQAAGMVAQIDAVGNESAVVTTATRNEPFIASSPPAPRLPALDPDRLAGLIALRYAT